MKHIYAYILLLLPFLLNAQGGIFIENGADLVVTGSPHIVVENGKFQNDGNFSAGNSTVHMKGTNTTTQSTIGGTSTTAFYNLNIQKSSHDVRLDYDIRVDGQLQMNGGNFLLNNSDILLGGEIIGETNTNRITGTTGGAIIKTVTLNMPSGENPGNIGVEITSSENMGVTTIQRRHTQLQNGSNSGIYRHFDISPANNANLNATLRMHFFESELAGLSESDLEIWQYDGSDWTMYSSESRNMADNWVQALGIPNFHTLTLAEDMAAPLPIELMSFDARLNEKQEVDLYWSTANEINNDHFIVERSKDGVGFEQLEVVPGAGTTTDIQHYKTVDADPFKGQSYYRLLQVDWDGTQTYSEIRTVNISSGQNVIVYPNPLGEALHINGDGFSVYGDTRIEMYDGMGKRVYSGSIQIDDPYFSHVIQEVSTFAAGNYFLVIQTPNENFSFNLVKISE